jgi:anti-sigma B factor antagonist
MGPHTDDDFRIDTHRDDGVVRLAVHGELDLGTSPALEEAIARAGSAARVDLDLSELSFMDSSGLAVLIGARKRAESGELELTVGGANEHVRRLMELTGTARFILGS